MDIQGIVGNVNASSTMRIVCDPSGIYELAISGGPQPSSMRIAPLAASLFAGAVDFHVERCPNVMDAETLAKAPGLWFTVNRCVEGRCEVYVPDGGYVVVEPGDICVSFSEELPGEFRYPLARYRGVELFVSTTVTDEVDFGILREAGIDLELWTQRVGTAAIFSGDAELLSLIDRIGTALGPLDAPRAKLAFMELILALTSRDLALARPRSFLTKGQMHIAASAHDELERDVAAAHDVRELARRLGVGTTTLNGYFSRVYGASVPAYLRARRMERAAELLSSQDASVAEVALAVGYANPSKFGAAFARAYGCTPSEWRRRHA